jgi:hypothetical protein
MFNDQNQVCMCRMQLLLLLVSVNMTGEEKFEHLTNNHL